MKFKFLFLALLCLCFSILLNYKLDPVKADVIDEKEVFEKDVSFAWKNVPYYEYIASEGDYFLVDVSAGIGYLMNDNTRYFTGFPVMTGGKRTPTPYKEWVVLQKDIKSNHIFYSASGEFFRMFENGTKRTGYGIHGYAYFDKEVLNGRKFLSWGCIMVADDVLDLLEESYIANGNTLKVSTKESIKVLF